MERGPKSYMEWRSTVIKHMPHLSKPQAVVLAMWSFGIAMTHFCGLSTVAVFLAELLNKPENTMRERLRQWYKPRCAKGSRKRAQLEVSHSFVPLLQWILSWWSDSEKSLVLAADASTLGERFTVLAISVVYRGCAIPVAWKIVEATAKGSWKPHWLKLFELLKAGVSDDWKVIVTTDRGLYAKWMYEAIGDLQWHPFMRINDQGQYRVRPESDFWPLKKLITEVGQSWAGQVTCFKTHSLDCTLLAQWDSGYSEPWLILTDLTEDEANIYWYAMRSWIECLFKDFKRGGFGWHHTKMTDPDRAERLWLAIAVATLWLVSVGGKADAQIMPSSLALDAPDHLSNESVEPQKPLIPFGQTYTPNPTRLLSCLRRGFLIMLAAVIKGLPLPTGGLYPEFDPATG